MEVDVQAPLKQALAKAKTFSEAKDWAKAASAYEKAANLMSMWAEQAHGRDAEERRKKMALQYRALAQKLRSGEIAVETPAPVSDAPSEKESPVKNGGAGGEIRSIVSNLSHASKITWDDIGGLDDTKNEIKFALGMTLAQHPPGVKIAAWTRILFYGPPGTGKTLLAAATSNAVKSTEGVPSVFYNVKVSSILSKYFGESSKIVSELYGTARDTSPSVVFL
ncbi:MAG: ATP-binding protein, partial [Planctomycetaceae bacterium]|nr:ATP-binding protein [Planctomycetaceae bacterium]